MDTWVGIRIGSGMNRAITGIMLSMCYKCMIVHMSI